ncbi:uncharacterized protein LOC115876787 [Sitophilus oryzae]|uniref:Uncharacterized protein LOC115876787 n=1 Tax=Sitophilus oryzae TaxID=7048 RepID=A0A6J2XBF5_SITOR|nr:uncharacterized protein LOC115876787 [Sitophilus oryzae]
MKSDRASQGCEEEPLCDFCLSPGFTLRCLSSETRGLAPASRLNFPQSTPSHSRVRLSGFFRRKSSSYFLQSIPGLFSHFKRRKSLTIEEILSTIQCAWMDQNKTQTYIKTDMEINSAKKASKESFFPVLQRRRLSVPETIMRKHMLAQEKLTSQESRNFQWGKEFEYSSDPNLDRKIGSNLIRKSTLLRRLWGNNSKQKLSGSFQEWQHSSRKLSSTQSLSSTHSSPEHLPRRKPLSNTTKPSSVHNNDEKLLLVSPKRRTTMSKTALSKDSTTKYSSFASYSDTSSDSAYTNSVSNLSFVSSTARKNAEDENCNRVDVSSRLSSTSLQESAVQTKDVANLNVISNVSLSQATLDVIFKQVMKDVSQLTPGEISISSATVTRDDKNEITVQETPSFFLNNNSQMSDLSSDKARIEKFIISNVRSGSSYEKSAEKASTTVPRFSAVPRTSSMEVNTSEMDREESDSASFADSLEDFNSPRLKNKNKHTTADITNLLPEGRINASPKKSSTFYIPIEVDRKEVKSVSELLPVKVREKLNERQHKREEKSRQLRSAFRTFDSISEIKNSITVQNYKPKKRIKPVLPSIESLKNPSKEKKHRGSPKDAFNRQRHTSALNGTDSTSQKHSVLYDQSKKTDWSSDTRKIYEKQSYENSGKKIEILEIVECISMPDRIQKSKIPVPVSECASKKPHFIKPVYLDFENQAPDPKFDQLIANILIDSLNHDVDSSVKETDKRNANFTPKNQGLIQETSKASAQIQAVAEETPAAQKKPSEKNASNNNNNVNTSRDSNKNKIPLRPMGRKCLSSIPHGWVTFYNVHKDMGTPDSTSDEGKKLLGINADEKDVKLVKNKEARSSHPTKSNLPRDIIKTESKDFSVCSSEDDKTLDSDMMNGDSFKKFGNHQRKPKTKHEDYQDKSSAKWSVTISGSNTYGQTAPDVEMRLKFPNIKHKYSTGTRHYSDSGLGEENIQERSFPSMRQLQDLERKFRRRDSVNENLPNIHTARSRRKKRESLDLSMAPTTIIPKQTKTSTSRYHLSRPRERYSLPEVPSMLNERQYCEILKRIPDILAVTGQSISPERRSIDDR